MPALKVARHLTDEEDQPLSGAAVSFLRTQAQKDVQTRLGDIEAWQVGANEYLAALADLTEFFDWAKRRAKIWLPIIAGAALSSATIKDFGLALLKAVASSAGHPLN
jgi:hypothetical protein